MERNKLFVIFIKRIVKYFSILAILIVMIAPLFFTSYKLARQLTIDKSNIKLKEGIDSLESQVIKAQEIANLLRQEDEFKRIFFLKGAPSSEYYVDVNKLQSKLKSLSLTQDLLSNVYIMFKDNPVFISNYISSDNYLDVYASYFHYKDMSINNWYDMLFEDNFSKKIIPSRQVFSSYYSGDYFEGVTALINNSNYNTIDQKSIMAIVFDNEDIINKILYDDQRGDHFAYIADNDNNIILSHNYDESETLKNVDYLDEITLSSQKYIAITYTSDILGMKTVVGIPLNTFKGNVNSLLELVMFYIIAGTIIIICLSLLFSMKETLWFTKISTINEEQRSRIETLNNSIKYSLLKHLLILGVYTEREIEEVESYFDNSFDNFCVAKVSYRIDTINQVNKSIQQNITLTIENTYKSIVKQDFVALNYHSSESVFVIFFDNKDDYQIKTIKDQFSELIRAMNVNAPVESTPLTINIGFSHIVSDIKNAKTAYQQAIYALSSNENDVSSGVYVFNPNSENADKLVFDITILLKLYDALIAGEKNIVSQIFSGSFNTMTRYLLTDQEQLQIFFSYRQTVYNAHKVIVNEKSEADVQFTLTLPDYDLVTDVIKLFNELNHVSMNLCDVVMNKKKSNNEKLKVDIVEYIKNNYADISLSASSIATQLLISEKYVFSFVKEQTGKSLGKFIEEVRISHAEILLLNTDYSNSKILQMCGFGSENTFYRAFSKKHAGSPTVWRENHKNLTE
jgi:AraC-like DNA-binding protein